jgi:hypothetical protein
MGEPILNASRVVAGVGERLAAGVAQHIVSTWLGFPVFDLSGHRRRPSPPFAKKYFD